MKSNAEAASKPGTVTLTKISSPAHNKIKINWKKTSSATHYRIYYRRSDTTKWTKIATVDKSKSSYTHKSSEKYPISKNKKYFYTVKGYNSKSKESGNYNKTGLSMLIPGTVKLSAISVDKNNHVKISWSKASGATHYRVYYRTDTASKWTKVATVDKSKTGFTHVSSLKYPINAGTKYFYTVKAYNSSYKSYGKYNSTGLSVLTSGAKPVITEAPKPTAKPTPKPTATPIPKPSKVNIVGIETSNGIVELYWQPIIGYDTYIVCKKHDPKDVWVGKTNITTEKVTYKGIACLKYTDKSARKGATNYYSIMAENSKTGDYIDCDDNGVPVFVEEPDTPKEMEDFTLNDMEVWMKDGPFNVDMDIYPENAIKPTFKWIVEDPSILTVDSNGRATALKTGMTMVRAVSPSGISDGCYITVYDPEDMIKQAVELANIERVKNNKAPFKTHPKLFKVAQARAEELIISYSHTRPNDAPYEDLTAQFECANTIGGENIAYGYTTAKEVIRGWMNSNGHRWAILDSDHTYVGIGVARRPDGCWFWSMNFASGDPDEKITIIFNTMGGNIIENYMHPKRTLLKVENLPTPIKNGYKFDGWYEDEEYTLEMHNIRYPNMDSMTLYAKWIKE